MALVIADRVEEVTSTIGSGTWSLAGATTGFQTFSSTVGNGNTTFYSASDGVSAWEVGLGTYTSSGNTLARTTVYASSNSGSAVSFSTAPTVWVDAPASRLSLLNASGNAQALGTIVSATLTNCTGLPVSTGISGFGTGVATALGNTAGGTGGFALQGSLSSYLPLTGGTMSGNIAMGGNSITNAATIGATQNIQVVASSGNTFFNAQVNSSSGQATLFALNGASGQLGLAVNSGFSGGYASLSLYTGTGSGVGYTQDFLRFVNGSITAVQPITLTGTTTVPPSAVFTSSNGTFNFENSGSTSNEIVLQHNGTDGFLRPQAGNFNLGAAAATTVTLTPTDVILASGINLAMGGNNITNVNGLTVAVGNFTSSLSTTGSSAGGGQFLQTDTASGGQTWQIGPGSGTGSKDEWNIYNQGTTTTILSVSKTGTLSSGTINSTASVFELNGNFALFQSGIYTCIATSNGVLGFLAGNATDPNNYYRNTVHYFGNIGGSVTYGSFGASGFFALGTNTNDSAAAGNIGEWVESIITVASPVSFTVGSGNDQNLTSISLTAGDWDVEGLLTMTACDGTGALVASTNTTTDTMAIGERRTQVTPYPPSASIASAVVPRRRYSLATTTTVYLVGRLTYTTAVSPTMYGFLNARRAR